MSFAKLATAIVLAAYAAPALAHMAISEPAPLRSKDNPQYQGSPLIDYSYTSPLAKDGSQYPCKGYHVDIGSVSGSTATITAGQQMTVKMAGSATHNGGSCQFALSYDNAASFGVIHEVVGGCPLDTSYSFTVPAGVPAGKNVIFAWTWFNKSGNREMYMNCAAIDIDSSGNGLTVPRLFEANIFGDSVCTTIEGQDVNFADPAPAVSNCPADKLVTKDKTVSFGAGGSGPAPEPTSAPEPTAAPEPEPTSAPEPEPTSAPEPAPEDPCPPEEEPPVEEDPCPPEDPTQAPPSTPTSSQAPTSSAPPSTPSAPPTSGGSCEAGAIQCSADGASWSMCANGAWVNMGAVAPGTTCSSGAMNVIKRSKFSASHYRDMAV